MLVELRDISGKLLYSFLIDDGSNVMRFESGGGFIAKDQCKYEKWTIHPMSKNEKMNQTDTIYRGYSISWNIANATPDRSMDCGASEVENPEAGIKVFGRNIEAVKKGIDELIVDGQ